MRHTMIMAAMMLAGTAACNPVPDRRAPADPVVSASLAGTEWILRAFGPEGADEPAGAPAITISFGADSTFVGSAGCNRYFGRYRAPGGDSLALGPAGSTMMACPEPAMSREHRYLTTLDSVARYRVTDGRLMLLDGSRELLGFAREKKG